MARTTINPASVTQAQIDEYVPPRWAGHSIDDLPNGIRRRVMRQVEADRSNEPMHAATPVDDG